VEKKWKAYEKRVWRERAHKGDVLREKVH